MIAFTLFLELLINECTDFYLKRYKKTDFYKILTMIVNL